MKHNIETVHIKKGANSFDALAIGLFALAVVSMVNMMFPAYDARSTFGFIMIITGGLLALSFIQVMND